MILKERSIAWSLFSGLIVAIMAVCDVLSVVTLEFKVQEREEDNLENGHGGH